MRLASASVQRLWLPVGLFVLAFAVRLLAAEGAAYGDELATLREAQRLGLNLNGIGFSILYNPWLSISTDLLWLRLLPIFFGSLSVVFCYLWLSAWRPEQMLPFLAAGLFAISPVAVEYSQQIRFYSFFLFSSTVFFWLYTLNLANPRRLTFVGLIAAGLLVLSAQMLGILVIAAASFHWLSIKKTGVFRLVTAVSLAFLVLVLLLAVISPSVLQAPYSVISRIFDGNANLEGRTFNYSGPRGWSPIIAVKVFFLGYHSVLGQYTYPLDLLWVLPSLLLFATLALLGVRRLYRQNRQALSFILFGFLFMTAVYLILDPLMPSQITASANIRLVIWIVPIILWLVAEGIYALRWRTLQAVALIAVIAMQFYGLVNMVNTDWEKPNYAEAIRAVQAYVDQEKTIILADGRSHGFIDFNLRQPPNLESAWQYIGKPDFVEMLRERGIQRVVMVSADFQDANRCQFSELLSQLSSARLEQGFVDYPFFIYAFDLNEQVTTQVHPVSAFHMRYQDVKLPQESTPLLGMYSLPNCQAGLAWQTRLADQPAEHIQFFSNVVSEQNLTDAEPVAKLVIVSQDNERIEFPIMLGQHTQLWNASPNNCSACEAVFSWRKRAALVGTSGYSGAYDDFQAQVWMTEFSLPNLTFIRELRLEVLKPNISLNVWGVMLRQEER